MKKMFVISWFFPPINAAEGIVTYKLLKKSKHFFDVYSCGSNDKYAFVDDNNLKCSNINLLSYNPKNKKDWINHGYKLFVLNRNKYNSIMSRCMPAESHELALKIKKKYKDIFFVASFSDPLAYSPYTKLIEEKNPYKNQQKSIKIFLKNTVWLLRRLRYRLFSDPEIKNKYIQKKTLKYADIIIFNNQYEKDYILNRYKNIKNISNKKFYIIPHSYDLSLYKNEKKFYDNKLVMSFLGHLDKFRNANVFLQSLNKLNQEYKNLSSILEVRFYGNICDDDKLYIFNNNLVDIVKIFKPVNYFDSLKIMKKSNYLLNIDANLSEYIDKNIFFASKLADYIGSTTKIFNISMDDSTTTKILNESDAVISNFDTKVIYNNLKKILNNQSKNNTGKLVKNLDNKIVSEQFDKIIQQNITE